MWSEEVLTFAKWVEKHTDIDHGVKLDVMDHLQRLVTVHYDEIHDTMHKTLEAVGQSAALLTDKIGKTVETHKTS